MPPIDPYKYNWENYHAHPVSGQTNSHTKWLPERVV